MTVIPDERIAEDWPSLPPGLFAEDRETSFSRPAGTTPGESLDSLADGAENSYFFENIPSNDNSVMVDNFSEPGREMVLTGFHGVSITDSNFKL